MSLNFNQQMVNANHDLVFVHGNLASSRWWNPILNNLSSDKFTQNFAYAIDLPGHGQSSLSVKINIDAIAAEVGHLLRQLPEKSRILIGHSAGGFLSALIASKYPHLVSGLILIGAVGPKGFRELPFDIDERYAEMNSNTDFLRTALAATIWSENYSDEYFEKNLLVDAKIAAKNIGSTLVKAFIDIDYSDKIKEISCPTLILHGDDDFIVPKHHGEYYNSLIAGSEIKIEKNWGHSPNYKNPKVIADLISNFSSSVN